MSEGNQSASNSELDSSTPKLKSTGSQDISDGFRQGNYDLSHLTPLTQENLNPSPEVLEQRSREKTKEMIKPPAIKKADAKMKELDAQVVDVSRNLNATRKAIDTNVKTLEGLRNQIDDPQIPQDQKSLMIDQYNTTLNDTKETEKTEKIIREKAIGLQKAKSTINKIYDVQNTLDMNVNDDALKATGNFLTHVYNAVPEAISGVGSLLEASGDVDLTTNAFQNVLTKQLGEEGGKQMADKLHIGEENKLTDIIGNAIQEMGHDLRSETDAEYDDKHYITSTAGDIVGSVMVAAAPAGIVSDAGKLGQMISGATTATMQMADQTHEQAKAAGLSDKDAGIMTLSIAPISGLLEVWGANNIINNVAGRKVIKELVSQSVKDLAGKAITKEIVFKTVGDNFKTIGKKYGLSALKSAGEEGATEGLQGEVQAAAENIYDESADQKAYGTKFFSAETQLDVAKQAAIGAVAGSAFGVLSGVSTPKNMYDKAIQLRENPEKMAQFRSYLDTEVQAGHVTIEQADDVKANVNAIIEADKKIPETITDKDKRFKAVELIKEKTTLENEIEGMDKAITAPQREKIKGINEELEFIATGKEKPNPATKKSVEPVAEKKPEVVVKPLSVEENTEYQRLLQDNELIGLEGKDQDRFNELKVRAEGVVTNDEKDRLTDTAKEKGIKSTIKESTENSVHPKVKEKTPIIKEEAPPKVEAKKERKWSPEKTEYVDKKIESLKVDEDAEFDEGSEPFYRLFFGKRYDVEKEGKRAFGPELSNRQKQVNTIVGMAADYNAMNNGRLGKLKPEGVKLRNDIEGMARELGLQAQVNNNYINLRNENGKKVRAVNTHLNNRAEAENHIPLVKRDESVISTFDKMNEHGVHAFPEIIGMDGKRMSSVQVQSAISDVLDGIPTNGANELLNQVEQMVKDGTVTITDPNTRENFNIPINDYMNSLISEDQEISDEKADELSKEYDDYFNSLSPEQQEEELKNFINEDTQQSAESTQDATDKESAEPDQTSEGKSTSTEEVIQYEGEVPFQKVVESNKYNKSQKRVARSVTNVVKALSKIAPDIKVVLHSTENSFQQASYEANKKIGLSENRAKKDVGGRAFYLGKGDHSIHINLPKVKSNTLFHEGIHPILNVVEELRPGSIDAMFTDLKAIEKSLKLDGMYTEDFAAHYGEKTKKLEAITEFLADVAAGKIQVNEGILAKIKRLFGRILKALGIPSADLDADSVISLAKKIQTGFEKGEIIDLETNRSLREIISGKYEQKTFAAKELEKQIKSTENELHSASIALDKKRAELDEAILDDQQNLFGERKPDGGMFDERVDDAQRLKILIPYQTRVDKALASLSELRKKLIEEEGKSDMLLFQEPGREKPSSEEVEWALRAFKKLGNFNLFLEKLSGTEKGRVLLEKDLFGAMLEANSSRPQASASDRLKALSDNIHKSSFIPQELKEKIDEIGLRSEVFSHEEARQIADVAIKELGIDGAVALANERLKGSVKAFVYGAAIDHYASLVTKATTRSERESYAQRGADIAEEFQKSAEDYGRFISAIGDYYKNSPLIIKKTEINKLRTKAKEALEKMRSKVNKVKSTKKELDQAVKNDIPAPKVNTPRAKLADVGERLSRRQNILDRWKEKHNAGLSKQVTGFDQEDTNMLVEMGAIHVADGAWTFPAWYKKMKADFGISESVAKEVWGKEQMPADLDDRQRTIESMITEDLGNTEEYKKQQEQILNKFFPKKIIESETVRKAEHEKIIEQYNAGVFDGGENMDGESFQKLFFDKMGIVNPDAPAIQDKIGEYADKISSAPEGSIMQREAQEDLMTYLAAIAYRTRLASGASKLSSIWYANILSSPATHLRNFQYNITTAAISQPFLLMEKAVMNGDFKAIGTHMRNIIEGFKKGLSESKRVITTGRNSRFDHIVAQNELERGKYIKPFVLPGRALKASDILFTDAAYNLKLSELARQLVKKENPSYTADEVNSAVDELLGNTAERRAAAIEQTQKEMEQFYGPGWKTMKGSNTIQKIRTFEIMEKNIPADMKEAALKWSKKALLTSRPTGVLGVFADAINGIHEKIGISKLVMPFVNVPLNIVNQLIEKTPIGLIKAFRQKEGFGKYETELSPDEVREIYLKVVNYALSAAVLVWMNGDDDDSPLVITGAQTGDYQDNKGIIRGGGLEPYSVYIKGKKVLSYKTSPLAAALLIPGLIRDAKLYKQAASSGDIASYTAMNTFLFINDQSSMTGLQNFVSTLANPKSWNADAMNTSLAKYAQGLVPYSGAQKYLNNTIKSISGEYDTRPIDPIEYLTKDLPFLDQLSRTRKDHFGKPVKENFDVPLFPAGQRGVIEMLADKSKYYELMKEKNFYPAFSTQRKMFVDGKQITMSKKDLDDINTDRGQLVAKALDSKNVFVPEDGAEGKYAEMTTMEYLKTLDNDEFAVRMKKLFEEGTMFARLRKYGSKVGITAKDVAAAMEENGGDATGIEYTKEEKNKELLEGYNAAGNFEIPIDQY